MSGGRQGPRQRAYHVGQSARFGKWHTLRSRKNDVHKAAPYKLPAPAPPAHAIIGRAAYSILRGGVHFGGELARTTRQCKRRHAGRKGVNVTKIAAAAEKPHSRAQTGPAFSGGFRRAPPASWRRWEISRRARSWKSVRDAARLRPCWRRRARRLIAIEIDRVLAAQLRMNFSQEPNVEIIEGDVLAIDFHTLFGPKPGSTRPGMNHQPEPVRVVGNLPYFITSDILLRLFEFRQYFETIVLMVQREVAERLAAAPGRSDYGLLSATAQLYARVERTVHASARRFLAAAQSGIDRGAAPDGTETR